MMRHGSKHSHVRRIRVPAVAIKFYATKRALVSVGTFARAAERSLFSVDNSQSRKTARKALWPIPCHPALKETKRSRRVTRAANPSAKDVAWYELHAGSRRKPRELRKIAATIV